MSKRQKEGNESQSISRAQPKSPKVRGTENRSILPSNGLLWSIQLNSVLRIERLMSARSWNLQRRDLFSEAVQNRAFSFKRCRTISPHQMNCVLPMRTEWKRDIIVVVGDSSKLGMRQPVFFTDTCYKFRPIYPSSSTKSKFTCHPHSPSNSFR